MQATTQDIERAMATRAEVIEAMGSDRGYAGQFIKTDRPCPTCKRQGRRTNGGTTPTLDLRVPDGVVTEALLCQSHGEDYR